MSQPGMASTSYPSAAPGRAMLWTGRVMTAIPVIMMLFSASMKFNPNPSPQVIEFAVNHLGWSQRMLLPIGILEVSCALLLAIPRTAVLGAILVTGYLGGAIATHLRVADVPIPQSILILLAWGGLYLRDRRLRELLPVRRWKAVEGGG